ncbi:MAG: sugar ABC transporter permease [Caldilineaceae bacterium]|nr:sugar ABC transporter permease [Caldilineaceae bacterium]
MSVQTAVPPGGSLPRRRRVSTRVIRDNIAGFLFISPWLLHFGLLIAFAMIYSFRISLMETDLLSFERFVGFGNYTRMWNDELFWKSFRVTAYYTFALVPSGIIMALAIALLMNQKVKLLGVWRMLYYLPSVVSGAAVAILWGYVLNPRFGLLNMGLRSIGIEGPRWLFSETWAVPGFILMGLWGAGGAMLLYLAGLQGIPTQLYEAAEIDGAGSWRRFIHITVPMLTPTIYFNLLINIIGSFQVFTQSYIMTGGGPNNATLTQVLYLYRKGFQDFQFGYASALAWALFVVIMLFTVLVVRSSDGWVHYEGELKK